ncbi:MAG TPA: 3-deoxy-7-phosphoheptulonate synthase, partial [Elusimicrobiota bacterium]|nr:3-deoxy-7-phosphoheptulonate synthase [Elusimicrobiota bacterium]
HDPEAGLDYARRLAKAAEAVRGELVLAMRVYFEKPRTTTGWKGLINDPDLDDSFHIEKGLRAARKLLLKITELGLPTATEALDPVVPQYIGELVCWYAIGARSIESQTHREMASGLSAPVGFKNGTDGNVQVAINAMQAVSRPHHFLGIDPEGRTSVFRTKGNAYSHVVLRGGASPNYDRASVARCEAALDKAGLRNKVLVDCSHGNSQKDHRRQPAVFESCMRQIADGDSAIVGMMVESNLQEGRQDIPPKLKGLDQLQYGVSVTDACIGWDATEKMIVGAL